MATGYYVNGIPLEESVVVTSGYMKKMIDDNFFKLSDYGFTNNTTSFAEAVEYNKGTWGAPLEAGYYKEGTPIPFVDPSSVPTPYLKYHAGVLYKQFPTEDIDGADNHGTAIKFITGEIIDAGGSLEISYDSTNQHLLVKKGSTNYVNAKASPYILFDIQAPGGSGGEGRCTNDYYLLNHYYALAGGGGGGAGNFVSLSTNLEESGTLSIGNSTNYYTVTLSNAQGDQIMIGKGAYGGDGIVSAVDNNTSATGGSTANAKNNYIANQNGETLKQTIKGIKYGGVYCVEALKGSAGATGETLTAKWADGKAYRAGTTANTIDTSILLTSVEESKTTCTKYGTNSKATGGSGENTSSATARFACGGGGGGHSLMADGGSYSSDSNYKPGIGAGGFGGSGWARDGSALADAGNNDGDYQVGSSGGPGAMWIYYIPLHNWSEWELVDEPTCTSEGKYQRTCSSTDNGSCNCGKTETKAISALGHTWVQTDGQSATETEAGWADYKCEVCKETKTELINALGYELINNTGYAIKDRTGFNDNIRIDANTTVEFTLYIPIPMTGNLPEKISVSNVESYVYNSSTGKCTISNPTDTVYIDLA